MKKWEQPQICDLKLQDTKGGPVYDPKTDGDAVYDPNTNKYWQPVGVS